MKVIGVIGNEACDADSIVSALVYAQFMNCSAPGDTQYIPFVQCSISDLSDRLDFVKVCEIVDLDSASLGLRSVLDYATEPPVHSWILIDHHSPSHIMQASVSEPTVVEIIDHHEVGSETAKSFVSTVPSVDIRVIGSCCSIIAERVLGSVCRDMVSHPHLFMLLLVIVLDTGNFNPATQKATPTDITVCDTLRGILNIPTSLDSYHEQLVQAKFNPKFWYHSPVTKLFNYDYKLVHPQVGYAVILRSLDGIADEDIVCFRDENQLRVFVVASGFFLPAGIIKRQLLITATDPEHLKRITADLHEVTNVQTVSVTDNVSKFEVFDESFSRKRFAPNFLQFLAKLSVISKSYPRCTPGLTRSSMTQKNGRETDPGRDHENRGVAAVSGRRDGKNRP